MRLPRIVYQGSAVDFTFPHRSWVGGTRGEGAGVMTSAAGVPSGWVTRRERPLRIELRFLEDEWPAVRTWLEYAQLGGAFTWYPDVAGPSFYSCYLVSPSVDEEVYPSPGEFGGELLLIVVIRRVDGGPIDEEFYV